MVNEGLLKKDSSRGVWEISDKGKSYLRKRNDADLAEITTVWPELPERIRVVIMTLVHTQGIKR